MQKHDLYRQIHGQPWVITREALDAIVHDIETIDLTARLRAEFGDASGHIALADIRRRAQEPDPPEIRGGVAVIPIAGSLTKRTSFWSWYFGRSTYESIRQQVQMALDDPGAKAILLNVDSPGGLVDGCLECADFLFRAAAKKPVYAWADGQMTSAAYKLGSVAREISAPATAMLGSIGVVMAHIDFSKMDERMGIKVTYLTAGKYKAMGNDAEPLSKEAEAYLQDHLDRTYSIFVDTVARNRAMDTEKVLAMADGKVFLARQALEVGMIDRIDEGLDAFLSYIQAKEETDMDLAKLKAEHPEVFEQAKAEGRAEAQGQAEKDLLAAVTGERARCGSIVSTVIDSHLGEAGKPVSAAVKAVVESDVTAEQVERMATAFLPSGAAGVDDGKQKILDQLKAQHHPPLNPDTGQQQAQLSESEKLAKEMADLANQAY